MSWEQGHRLVDRLTPSVRRQVADAFRLAQAGVTGGRIRVPVAQLRQIIEGRGLSTRAAAQLAEALPVLIDRAIGPPLLRVAREAVTLATADLADLGVSMTGLGNIVNPLAVEAARAQGALLVTRIAVEARIAIQTIIAAAIEHGITAPQSAQLIRTVVGLNGRQAQAVVNFRQQLRAQGASADLVRTQSERYAARLLRQRANAIARTELIDALTRGQQATWQIALSEGRIPPHAMQQWIITPDDRLCPLCKQMVGARALAPVGGMFQTPLGPKRGPTMHTHCRCAVRLVASSLRRRAA